MKKTKKKKQQEKPKGGAAMMVLALVCVVIFVSAIFAFITPKQQNIVLYMFENNVKLLKTEGCGWCQKQLQEFTQEELWDMEDSSLVVECLQNKTWICGQIGTPAWWMNGKVVFQGYLERDKIIKTLEVYVNG